VNGPASEPATSVDDVLELYRRFGPDHYDEEVSQLDHALQCAALARAEGAPDELVAAALLHDVGHLVHLQGGAEGPAAHDTGHESVGAHHLSGLFGLAVTGPIELHVRAKRYLCAVEPGTAQRLSDGSRASLVRQGGPMDDDEVATFRADPSHGAAVRLRRWDDAGKVEDLDVEPLDAYEPLLRALSTS
jgi:phosphonate degradation associated HDIG domain protein